MTGNSNVKSINSALTMFASFAHSAFEHFASWSLDAQWAMDDSSAHYPKECADHGKWLK
jgi:hypothetical protein